MSRLKFEFVVMPDIAVLPPTLFSSIGGVVAAAAAGAAIGALIADDGTS